MWPRRRVLGFLGSIPAAAVAGCATAPESETSSRQHRIAPFACNGYTPFGTWRAAGIVSSTDWRAGDAIDASLTLELPPGFLERFESATGIAPDSALLLVTNERAFDADGVQRFPLAHQVSTLLTPSGLAIEGGDDTAITPLAESPHVSPIEERIERRLRSHLKTVADGTQRLDFRCTVVVPDDLPPGIERLRFDFGFAAGYQRRSISGEGFARRPQDRDKVVTTAFGPPVRVHGWHASGRFIYASAIRPRLHWSLLQRYSSNGTFGVVADEDADRYALTQRHILQDLVVLPIAAYNLEPEFIVDTIDLYRVMPWKVPSGQLAIQVIAPDGQKTDLGHSPFVAFQRPGRPTTKRPSFANWKPAGYGLYTARAEGWIEDAWGNRYEGGGTYRFWIAERMTWRPQRSRVSRTRSAASTTGPSALRRPCRRT